ncbi:MAG: molybdopterin-guanine dinucleotide biosynthesis protein B [Pseudomonadota bacterium]|nr:molybdopterin-guanine dinucleotide biosynthesis protein B [Pseudomonadota bacterium]
MKIFGLAGWSGSGKTKTLVSLVSILISRGISVSTVKHAHHTFDIDKPGKDSYEHRRAGANEVLVSSSQRWALMHENPNEMEVDLNDLIRKLTPVDLILIEGFKFHPHPKIEIHRPALGKKLIGTKDPHIVAVASDKPLKLKDLPVIDLNNPSKIADFIEKYTGLIHHTKTGVA